MRARPILTFVLGSLVALCVAMPLRGQDACATPRLLTPTGSPLQVSGFGLVVADPRPDAQLAIGLLRGRRRTALAATPIGPGLFRISATVRAGLYRLDGVTAPSELTLSTRASRLAPATAPAVRAARRVTSTQMGSGQTRTEILVDLSFPVPPGVIVARAQWNGSADVGVWTSLAAGQNSFAIATQPSCVPSGWQPPPDGPLSMVVTFVDQLGQISPPSTSVNVE
ncbi:MAG: hypothetical protein K1X94_17495 [Sandaracinaceae bacterium]|nr:hypothetical protein [Sandaracinaceae bacterium]